MLVFLDTSVLLKLYVDEEGADEIREVVYSDTDIVVSAIAYVEAHSAFARRSREGSIGKKDIAKILQAFETDWATFAKIRVDDAVLRRAGTLCVKRGLRSLDAIQLATALVASKHLDDALVFLTADHRLAAVARQEKLKTQIDS